MERQFKSKYLTAAHAALVELGGGPVASKVLIDFIVEQEMLPDRKCLYHNVLRKVRQSDAFDTTDRGQVKLAPEVLLVEVPEGECEVEVVQEADHAGVLDEVERALNTQATPLSEIERWTVTDTPEEEN